MPTIVGIFVKVPTIVGILTLINFVSAELSMKKVSQPRAQSSIHQLSISQGTLKKAGYKCHCQANLSIFFCRASSFRPISQFGLGMGAHNPACSCDQRRGTPLADTQNDQERRVNKRGILYKWLACGPRVHKITSASSMPNFTREHIFELNHKLHTNLK